MKVMPVVTLFLCLALLVTAAYPATLGRVVPVVGGASDIVLDEPRARLYLVNTNRNQVEVFSTRTGTFQTAIPVEQQPLAADMSRSGKTLYVTAHSASALVEIDLETLQVANRVSLPARPEGVAVGNDERVLISTVGTGQNNLFNVLLIYNPLAPQSTPSLSAVPVAPPPPANPLVPPANLGRPGLSNRSFLRANADGRFIFGVNIPNTTARAVFVYEVASGSVLRSRTVAGVSTVLSVAPDASKFMAGLTLFDTESLAVLAQQNAANAPYPFAPGANFNLQQNQGGSVFSPDGSVLYSAFNFAPVTTPATRPNVSQLMVNDPDNLLVHTAYQMQENLAGKMVISSDGGTIYAISESGFVIVPLGAATASPVAKVENRVSFLANDQCGALAALRRGEIPVTNEGRGRLTVSAQLLQQPQLGPGGIGGPGGPGGGLPGGGVIIILPPFPGQPGQPGQPLPPPPVLPGGQPTGQNAASVATAPPVRVIPSPSGGNVQFTFNPNAARGLGTVVPHQFLIQSNEAVNIPDTVTVFQNNRNTETPGEIKPVDVGISPNERLVDMVLDGPRGRLYIANSGMNRVEVFDTKTRTYLAPVKVGQLPRSLAMSPDGQTLYVANSGGETVSIVDLQNLENVGRVRFPAIPFNANITLVTPQAISAGQRGPLVMMNNGAMWRITGNEAIPRRFNAAVLPPNAQNQQVLPAPRTMAATPNGEFILVLAGNGFAYLYDAQQDDFIQGRQIVAAPITGYYGPVTAGPRGQYYVVNGLLLNSSLTPVGSAGTIPGGTAGRPVAAVAAVGGNTYARFVQPFRANANAVVTDPPVVEIADAVSGNPMRVAPALEGPLSTPTGNQRANVDGRTMAVDALGEFAYILTTSGLSVVQLNLPPPVNRPSINPNGAVNLASYLPTLPQGGLISVFGRNLAGSGVAGSTPLPTIMGGTCVTVNNQPIPLLMSSPEHINAQLPPSIGPGRYPIVVRSVDNMTASLPQQITVARYAPAVFVDPPSGQAAIFHLDGTPVTPQHPAKRDERLTLYAAGLGPPRGATLPAGVPAPAEPLLETEKVQVFFGDPRIAGSEMVVEWSGLVPGYIGLYQLNLYVPWNRHRGEALPVTLRIGNVQSPSQAPVLPYVAVE